MFIKMYRAPLQLLELLCSTLYTSHYNTSTLILTTLKFPGAREFYILYNFVTLARKYKMGHLDQAFFQIKGTQYWALVF